MKLDTKQAILDRVARHLFRQGRRAFGPDPDPEHGGPEEACLYRTSDGCRCSVGCLIVKRYYNEFIERCSVVDACVQEALTRSGVTVTGPIFPGRTARDTRRRPGPRPRIQVVYLQAPPQRRSRPQPRQHRSARAGRPVESAPHGKMKPHEMIHLRVDMDEDVATYPSCWVVRTVHGGMRTSWYPGFTAVCGRSTRCLATREKNLHEVTCPQCLEFIRRYLTTQPSRRERLPRRKFMPERKRRIR